MLCLFIFWCALWSEMIAVVYGSVIATIFCTSLTLVSVLIFSTLRVQNRVAAKTIVVNDSPWISNWILILIYMISLCTRNKQKTIHSRNQAGCDWITCNCLTLINDLSIVVWLVFFLRSGFPCEDSIIWLIWICYWKWATLCLVDLRKSI